MPRLLHLFSAGAALLLLWSGCGTPKGPASALPTAASAAQSASTEAAGQRPDGRGNAFVLLSGGGTPLSNNYSQYLQARAIAHLFATRYADQPSWVFFGVGNREGEEPVLADSYRQVHRDGRLLDTWLPGRLPRNRPATRESFLTALKNEILPTVRNGGTLYLFVGDHGSISGGEKPESEITLWELKRNPKRGDAWFTDRGEKLGVDELRQALAAGLGRGRVVFVMTQCHSGGFHYLGVPREVRPPAAWFLSAPPAAAVGPAQPRLAAAGFTATDERSLAAGCDPDPDPDQWAGYERFLPEALLGLNLFDLQPKGTGSASLAAAHEAATLVDATIDKPRSSSEQYLERWATAIERLAEEARLTPRAAAALAAYRQTVDTGRVKNAERDLQERAAQFARFVARLQIQVPAARDLLIQGSRENLETTITPAAPAPGGRGGRGRRGVETMRAAWKDQVRPAWKAAVLAGQVPGLGGAALEFEKYLLEQEDRGREFLLPRGGRDPMLNEIYWRSGYAYPATLDRAKAEAVAAWGAARRDAIAAWAREAKEESVRRGIAVMFPTGGRRGPAASVEAEEPLTPQIAAERVLFYRRTLAAWEFLLAMQHGEALAELRALTKLERTPLP